MKHSSPWFFFFVAFVASSVCSAQDTTVYNEYNANIEYDAEVMPDVLEAGVSAGTESYWGTEEEIDDAQDDLEPVLDGMIEDSASLELDGANVMDSQDSAYDLIDAHDVIDPDVRQKVDELVDIMGTEDDHLDSAQLSITNPASAVTGIQSNVVTAMSRALESVKDAVDIDEQPQGYTIPFTLTTRNQSFHLDIELPSQFSQFGSGIPSIVNKAIEWCLHLITVFVLIQIVRSTAHG